MFCKNCGKENSDGSQVCKFCGQNLTSSVTENSVKPVVNTKKSKKPKILIISVIVILALLVGGGLFFMFRTTTPNIEQLKSDFISEVLKDEKYSISKFDVINETDGKNDNMLLLMSHMIMIMSNITDNMSFSIKNTRNGFLLIQVITTRILGR